MKHLAAGKRKKNVYQNTSDKTDDRRDIAPKSENWQEAASCIEGCVKQPTGNSQQHQQKYKRRNNNPKSY